MRRSRKWVGVVLLGVAVVSIANCGGGGSESSGDHSATLTRTAFVKAANSLCKQSRVATGRRLESAKAWIDPGNRVTRQVEEKAIRFMVVAPTEELSEQLERLGPISGDAPELEAYVATLARDVELARARPLTVTTGTAFTASDAIANEQGLPICVH